MNDQPYQLLPPLSAEEYAALREDIASNGVRVPVDVDEHGQVLDGHHRLAIAAELGIDCPTRVVSGLTEEDKRAHALAVNLQRRTLTREQRRDLVVAELEYDPSRSDRAIGRLCGVDHKTVGAIRRGGWGIPHHPQLTREQAEEFTASVAVSVQRMWTDIDAHIRRILRIPGVTPPLMADVFSTAMLRSPRIADVDVDDDAFQSFWTMAVHPRMVEILKYPAGAYGAGAVVAA